MLHLSCHRSAYINSLENTHTYIYIYIMKLFTLLPCFCQKAYKFMHKKKHVYTSNRILLCVCVCVYIYIYIYIYTHTYECMYVQVHVSTAPTITLSPFLHFFLMSSRVLYKITLFLLQLLSSKSIT